VAGQPGTLGQRRGGPESPIRIYADEEAIEHLIGRWNDDTGEHQRALARIASFVPQFGDWYGEALTHLRKLQSDSAVYLPVIEQVKTNIATELERDNPDALEPMLKETAEKYPALAAWTRYAKTWRATRDSTRSARSKVRAAVRTAQKSALRHPAVRAEPSYADQ